MAELTSESEISSIPFIKSCDKRKQRLSEQAREVSKKMRKLRGSDRYKLKRERHKLQSMIYQCDDRKAELRGLRKKK